MGPVVASRDVGRRVVTVTDSALPAWLVTTKLTWPAPTEAGETETRTSST